MSINYLNYNTIADLQGIVNRDALDKGCDVEWSITDKAFGCKLHMDHESVEYHVPNFQVLRGQMNDELEGQGGLVADAFWDMMNEHYRV